MVYQNQDASIGTLIMIRDCCGVLVEPGVTVLHCEERYCLVGRGQQRFRGAKTEQLRLGAYDCGPARRKSRSARNTLLYRPSIHRRPFDVTFK